MNSALFRDISEVKSQNCQYSLQIRDILSEKAENLQMKKKLDFLEKTLKNGEFQYKKNITFFAEKTEDLKEKLSLKEKEISILNEKILRNNTDLSEKQAKIEEITKENKEISNEISISKKSEEIAIKNLKEIGGIYEKKRVLLENELFEIKRYYEEKCEENLVFSVIKEKNQKELEGITGKCEKFSKEIEDKGLIIRIMEKNKEKCEQLREKSEKKLKDLKEKMGNFKRKISQFFKEIREKNDFLKDFVKKALFFEKDQEFLYKLKEKINGKIKEKCDEINEKYEEIMGKNKEKIKGKYEENMGKIKRNYEEIIIKNREKTEEIKGKYEEIIVKNKEKIGENWNEIRLLQEKIEILQRNNEELKAKYEEKMKKNEEKYGFLEEKNHNLEEKYHISEEKSEAFREELKKLKENLIELKEKSEKIIAELMKNGEISKENHCEEINQIKVNFEGIYEEIGDKWRKEFNDKIRENTDDFNDKITVKTDENQALKQQIIEISFDFENLQRVFKQKEQENEVFCNKLKEKDEEIAKNRDKIMKNEVLINEMTRDIEGFKRNLLQKTHFEEINEEINEEIRENSEDFSLKNSVFLHKKEKFLRKSENKGDLLMIKSLNELKSLDFMIENSKKKEKRSKSPENR